MLKRPHDCWVSLPNCVVGLTFSWVRRNVSSGINVLPRLAVVQTSRGLYGFQEARGHWTNESLGTNEHAKQVHGRGHALVVITTERVLVFSSFTGGFFSLPWSTDERVLSVDDTNDAVMVRTSARLLAFRSQTTEWVEVNSR